MVRRGLLTLILIGLFLRIAYAVGIYDPTLLNYNLDDFISYKNAAIDILQGDLLFTNSLYMKRPPVYSLLVAILGIQPFLIIAANIFLGIVIIPLTYVLARQLRLCQELAMLAALVVALDPTSIRASVMLRADSLANFWLAFAFVSLIKLKQADEWQTTLTWGLLSGIFIILSAFTRPAAYLLWIPMGIWVVFARLRGGGAILAILALVTMPILGIRLWQQHNALYFNNGSFSTAGTFQLLYVRAASVLHQATNQDIDDVYTILATRVEKNLGNEVKNITATWRHRHLSSTSEMQSVMTEIAVDVFLEYPLYYILTIPVGLYRALLNVSAWQFWVGIGWNLLLLLVSGYGLLYLLRLRRIADAMFLLLPCVYFLTGTLLVATASFDTRARVMITPLLAVMAAYGVRRWVSRRRVKPPRLSLADSKKA